MRSLRLLLAAGTLAGCDLAREPTPLAPDDHYVAVHALLLAGADSVAVLVTRVQMSQSDTRNAEAVPVTGAHVRLSAGTERIELKAGGSDAVRCTGTRLQQPALGPGCYTGSVAGGIRPGVTYALEVALTGGGVITGSATVPEAPAGMITDPRHATLVIGQVGSGTTDRAVMVRWDPLPASDVLRLSLSTDDDDCWARLAEPDHNPALWLDVSGRASIEIGAQFLFCHRVITDTVFPGHLQLTHYDDTYASYLETFDDGSSSIPADRLAFGLDGAAGVFAAEAIARVPVTVLRR